MCRSTAVYPPPAAETFKDSWAILGQYSGAGTHSSHNARGRLLAWPQGWVRPSVLRPAAPYEWARSCAWVGPYRKGVGSTVGVACISRKAHAYRSAMARRSALAAACRVASSGTARGWASGTPGRALGRVAVAACRPATWEEACALALA